RTGGRSGARRPLSVKGKLNRMQDTPPAVSPSAAPARKGARISFPAPWARTTQAIGCSASSTSADSVLSPAWNDAGVLDPVIIGTAIIVSPPGGRIGADGRDDVSGDLGLRLRRVARPLLPAGRESEGHAVVLR